MKINRDYYLSLIEMEEQSQEVAAAIKLNEFEPFLTYWNKLGSD
jgi:hypothetical protein